MTTAATDNHYFVDEAGDLTLFNKRGRINVGEEGVSRYFMVAVAHIPKPQLADGLLKELRDELLADPYFQSVPSMQAQARKTALAFHASKDLPEVRRDMFARLPILKAKVQVAIRRKDELAKHAQLVFSRQQQKWRAADVYDDLVARLFKTLLHKATRNRIVFAKHAKWGRREAMGRAIQKARMNFEGTYGIESRKPTEILCASPSKHGGLQVVDYYLWAIQRMYERGEDRYFNLLRPGYRLIMDLDDERNRGYGEWYTDDNPLTLARIKPPVG